MKRKMISALVLSMLVFSVSGQNYSIDWFTIDGGGGASSGGGYTLNGSIGQADAGAPMTGGNYSLTGGFWSLIATVSTPGLPLLTITLASPDTAMISWPSPSAGFVLEESANLMT